MSRTAAVRVLPSSRPASRTWETGPTRPDVVEPPPDVPVPTPRPGRVARVGRTWAATVPDELPDAARWSGWFALALGEAVLGRRPATQLAGWLDAEVLAVLNRRQRLSPAQDAAPRTVLISGRVQHPAARTAEATATLRCGGRLLVLAFRLEGVGGQWVCTALEAGFTPGAARRRTRGRPAATAPAPAGGTPRSSPM